MDLRVCLSFPCSKTRVMTRVTSEAASRRRLIRAALLTASLARCSKNCMNFRRRSQSPFSRATCHTSVKGRQAAKDVGVCTGCAGGSGCWLLLLAETATGAAVGVCAARVVTARIRMVDGILFRWGSCGCSSTSRLIVHFSLSLHFKIKQY